MILTLPSFKKVCIGVKNIETITEAEENSGHKVCIRTIYGNEINAIDDYDDVIRQYVFETYHRK